jgi:hypothetical protein
MLAGILGVRLILWSGKNVPVPAPAGVLSALEKVEVTNDSENGDGFQMTFLVEKEKSLDFDLLNDGSVDPFNRVIIGVVLGVMPEVLIDGIITHHQLEPGTEEGTSRLIVTGKDVSVMLDLEEKNDKYENQPDFLIVTRLIAGYMQYGLVPAVTPTTDIPIMIQRIPRQHETDLAFIKRLAQRNGFVFYIEPLTFGVNTAYWGPDNRIGIPQPALTANMGSWTNVTSISTSQDPLSPVGTKGTFVEPITKISIPIPSLPSLRIPPLSSSPTQARRIKLLRNSANQNPAQAAVNAVSTVTNAPESVNADGELETVRYGNVLRARKLVGVRGIGLSYDGNYYVRKVTHVIQMGKEASYTQRFKISKEGTGSLVPVVKP